MEGSILGGAHMEDSNLERAHLEGSNLWQAHLEGSDLCEAHLEGSILGGAHMGPLKHDVVGRYGTMPKGKPTNLKSANLGPLEEEKAKELLENPSIKQTAHWLQPTTSPPHSPGSQAPTSARPTWMPPS